MSSAPTDSPPLGYVACGQMGAAAESFWPCACPAGHMGYHENAAKGWPRRDTDTCPPAGATETKFGDSLWSAMTNIPLTPPEVAALFRCSPATIHLYLSGRSAPHPDMERAFREILHQEATRRAVLSPWSATHER